MTLDEAMTEETYAIAVPLGSDLTEVVNEVIKELNESGEMDKIVSAYISDGTDEAAEEEASSDAA